MQLRTLAPVRCGVKHTFAGRAEWMKERTHVAGTTNAASDSAGVRFGVKQGQVIQEFGYDDDVDSDLRSALEEATGSELVDEDYDDVTDAALVWWREDDGDTHDLTDLLVDTLTTLEDGGLVWVLTPKPGRPGHVAAPEVDEAARTGGLHSTSTISAAEHWTGFRLTTRGRGR